MKKRVCFRSTIVGLLWVLAFWLVAPLSGAILVVVDDQGNELNEYKEQRMKKADDRKDTDKQPESGEKKKKSKKKAKKGNDKVEFFAELKTEYSDNIFGLSGEQKDKLNANATEDKVSGRFSGMDSISDYSISPSIMAKYKFKNTPIGKINATGLIRHNLFKENSKANFTEGHIKLEKKINDKNDLKFEGEFAAGKLKKNYISGYNDANKNGNIPREERIYSAAFYDELETTLSLRHRLIKEKNKTLTGLSLTPFVGYRWRDFNSDFNNRDYKLPFAGLKLGFEFKSRFDIEVKYQYGKLDSSSAQELTLYDETIAGADVNGDGKVKSNAPLVNLIDRSCSRKTLEFAASYKLSKKAKFSAEYSNRKEIYSTDNQLDIDRYHRDGSEKKFKSGLKFDLAKDFSAEIEYQKNNNRDSDDDEYSENRYLLSLQLKLD